MCLAPKPLLLNIGLYYFQENWGGRNLVLVNEVNMAEWGLASAIT